MCIPIVLVKRAEYPFKDMWALPGGFLRPDEDVYETAQRNLFEETNVKAAYLSLAGVFGDVGEASWFSVKVNSKQEKKKSRKVS